MRLAKDHLTIALPKGRLFEPSVRLFREIGLACPDLEQGDGRKLFFEVPRKRVRFVILRATDVPTYVEYGVADMGIVGKDMLLEQGRDVYEPLDLGFGRCRIMVAEPASLARGSGGTRTWSNIRIATKYPNLTERFFSQKGVPVEVIKLYGSVELAPLLGLADRVVDLVGTGRTLKAHGLVPVEVVAECTARLIVNRASLKIKHRRIHALVDRLAQHLARSGKA